MAEKPRDIVERLEEHLSFHAAPEFVQTPECGDARVVSCDIIREIITTIKFLRKAAGAVSDGPCFAEITKDLPRRSTEPPDPS